MTSIIAEIGWNHMGDMNLAENMIRQAAKSGAKYAKFQTWSVKRLKKGEWDHDGRRQIYEKAELTHQNHEFLISCCKNHNIKFLSSCFSLQDAALLKEIGQREVKIPSFEVRNQKLINYCLKEFEHVFISTGTANSIDLENLRNTVKDFSITIMHCVSSYPCLPENANLPRIYQLKKMFKNVGYSDHVSGVDASIASLQYHPTYIEKHFTVDKDLPGRDNKFAILPNEMYELANFIRNQKLLMIDHGINYQPCEESSRRDYDGRFSNE